MDIKLECFRKTTNIGDNYESCDNSKRTLVISQNQCWIKNLKKRTLKAFNLKDLKNKLCLSEYSGGYETIWEFDNGKILKALGYELRIEKIKK